MEEVEITTKRLVTIWWALIWRLFTGYLLLILLIIVASFALVHFNVQLEGATRIAWTILGFLGQLGIVFLAIRDVFAGEYHDFSIALVRCPNSTETVPGE